MGWFNKMIAETLPFVPKPVVGFFSKQYIAGAKLEDAVRVVKMLNDNGMMATIDVLGEEVTEKSHSSHAVQIYRQVLEAVKNEKLDANISVKPTHMGLEIDKDFCYQNIKELVTLAGEHNNFVRIDMEDATTTDDTLEMFLSLRKEFSNVGTVLQAYLRRTVDDINALLPHTPNLRLCKGIYNEKRKIAYKDKMTINDNFKYSLEKLLGNGCYVGIATHDERLVWHALKVVDELKLKPEQYEFQMLLGVDEELRRIIVNAGHRLRVYVPFGEDWFGYSTRRLKENPDIAGHVIRDFLGRLFGRKK